MENTLFGCAYSCINSFTWEETKDDTKLSTYSAWYPSLHVYLLLQIMFCCFVSVRIFVGLSLYAVLVRVNMYAKLGAKNFIPSHKSIHHCSLSCKTFQPFEEDFSRSPCSYYDGEYWRRCRMDGTELHIINLWRKLSIIV